MKIFESLATYQLSVILTDEEAEHYRQAFRSNIPIQIQEFENKFFQIKVFSKYYLDDVPENSYEIEMQEVLEKDHAMKRDAMLKDWGIPMRKS